MKAVIMAGGEGTRLRPLTSNAPKPMLPIVNVPMMEHVVNLLRTHGFDEIIVTVAFLANVIKDHFGDGSEFGVSISYANETTPLGTAGSVRNAMERLDERFLVISGDVITDIDLGKLVAFHDGHDAMATIGLIRVENPLEFGIVITRDDGTIERFLEKPTWGQVFSDTINTGIYVLDPTIFDYIPAGRPVDFSSEVFPAMLADRKALYGAVAEGYWEDVGTLEAYVRAHKDVLDGAVRLLIPGFNASKGIWLGEGAEISPEATVDGPAVIGPGSTVGPGTHLGEYVVLGSNVRLIGDASFERSVVHDNVYVGNGVRLRGTVVGRSCNLRSHATCEEGVVLGDEVYVGANAVVGTGVKVYPLKTIEDGAVVNSSIVWESRGARSLFGRNGVHGLANVDITPELAVKLAMSYGTSLKRGATVVVSRDSSKAARMLKRAMMAGLTAVGVNVLDLELSGLPVTRFMVRSPRASGGISVRLDHDDPTSVLIRFFDGAGVDLAEDAQRRIERLFQREDHRRVLAAEIGDISYPPRALDDYNLALEATVDLAAISARRFKLVIDYSYGATAYVMPNVLAKMGADVLAVNPYASTEGLLTFDLDAAARRVAALVRTSGAQLGAVLDPDGDVLLLIDDEGHVLTHREATLAFVELVCDHLLGDTIAVPVNLTGQIERLAASRGVAVRRTKLSAAALMDAAGEHGVGFAADGEGGYILPGFLPAFDAAAALVKMMDLLARSGRNLAEVRRGLPDVHLTHETVVTPWEHKGLVMRTLIEQADGDLVLVDGVKCFGPDGWTLAVPDPEEPITHVWAEADTEPEARQLGHSTAQRIRQVVH